MSEIDFLLGFDSGSSFTKLLSYRQRSIGVKTEEMIEAHLISANVTPIDAESYERDCRVAVSEFGTGSVALKLDKKQTYFRVGGVASRVAVGIPKWQSSLVKLVCILGWVDKKVAYERRKGPLKGRVIFSIPFDERAYAKPLAQGLRDAIELGAEVNGEKLTIGHDKESLALSRAIEGEGLLSSDLGASAALIAGHADLSFVLAHGGRLVEQTSFVAEGSGCLQVLRLSGLPSRSELDGARALATGQFKYFAEEGLSVADVKAMVKKGQDAYVLANAERIREIRSALRDNHITSLPFAGGSSAFLAPLIAPGIGAALVLAPELSAEFAKRFKEDDPSVCARFLDVFGVWSRLGEVKGYFAGVDKNLGEKA